VNGGRIVQNETAEFATGAVMARRTALVTMGAVGATAVVGCSSYGGKTAAPPAAPAGTPGELGATGDVPVGGGKVFGDKQVVVTQPSQGTFAAFSAVCTHQGCTVDEVKEGTINCPCHGSKFKIADGSVADGPAPKALERKTITVVAEKIILS
jgi:nitrite reductase/ring-hydroxylating ferredoxin subunit